MKKVLIRLQVAALEPALRFYCEELALFSMHQDYGMNTVAVAYKANESILLLLSEGTPAVADRADISIEIDRIESLFNRLSARPFASGGRLLSEQIFEYPLERSLLLQDPSGNRFILFEAN